MKRTISLFLTMCVVVMGMSFASVSAATTPGNEQLLLVDAIAWNDTARNDLAAQLNILSATGATTADVTAGMVTAVQALVAANGTSTAVQSMDDAAVRDALESFVTANRDSKLIYAKRELPKGYVATAVPADIAAIAATLNEEVTGDAANDNGTKFVIQFLREATLINYAMVLPAVPESAALGYYSEEGSRIDFEFTNDVPPAVKSIVVGRVSNLIKMFGALMTSIGAQAGDSDEEIFEMFVNYAETAINGTGEELAFYEYVISHNPNYNDLNGTIIEDGGSPITADDVSLVILTYEAAAIGGGGSYLPETEQKVYNVTFDAGELGTLVGSASAQVAEGGRVTSAPTVTVADEKYEFAGWSLDGETVVDVTTVEIVADTVFKAVYKETTVEPEKPTMPKLTSDHIVYMIGDDKGYFNPEHHISRAETAIIIYRLLEEHPTNIVKGAFSDVVEGAWYEEAVYALSNLGVLKGYHDGTFRPDADITRAEFAALAVRFTDAIGSKSFIDVSSDHWAEDYIAAAHAADIIQGYPDGTFRPDEPILRSEATLIMNALLGREPDKNFIDHHAELVHFPDVPETYWDYYDIMEATNAHDYKFDDNGVEKWLADEQ